MQRAPWLGENAFFLREQMHGNLAFGDFALEHWPLEGAKIVGCTHVTAQAAVSKLSTWQVFCMTVFQPQMRIRTDKISVEGLVYIIKLVVHVAMRTLLVYIR